MMYDQVRVYFVDGTETVIYVGQDTKPIQALANLQDELGLQVENYRIECQVKDED